MAKTMLTTLAAFIGTNIDDIVMLTVLFAAVRTGKEKRSIALGQTAGFCVALIISIAGAYIAKMIPGNYFRLLGIIPIVISVKNIIKGSDDEEIENAEAIGFLDVMLIAFADSGDNIGVYIPLFTSCSLSQTLATAALYLILEILICLLCMSTGKLSRVQNFVRKYSKYLVPAILIILGLSILLGI